MGTRVDVVGLIRFQLQRKNNLNYGYKIVIIEIDLKQVVDCVSTHNGHTNQFPLVRTVCEILEYNWNLFIHIIFHVINCCVDCLVDAYSFQVFDILSHKVSLLKSHVQSSIIIYFFYILYALFLPKTKKNYFLSW